MMSTYSYTLIHSVSGDPVFKVLPLEDPASLDKVQRLNHYSMILITEGGGRLQSDFSEYVFNGPSLLCFAPYQPFRCRLRIVRGGLYIFIRISFVFTGIIRMSVVTGCCSIIFTDLPFMRWNRLYGNNWSGSLTICARSCRRRHWGNMNCWLPY